MKIGILIQLNDSIEQKFAQAAKLGFDNCQLVCWEMELMTDAMVHRIKSASLMEGIEITGLWCGWPGPCVWDFVDGPLTLGLVPQEYRYVRMEALKSGSDFARKLSVKFLITHVGFLPEDMNSHNYQSVLSALRNVVHKCQENEQIFLFETGQETPVTLKRTIQDIGFVNVGINLDPANLLMYGKGNPVDALDILGEYIYGVHAKDGTYPTDARQLGKEMPLGTGQVNFAKLIRKLKSLGYEGSLTIEREISGEKQLTDIISAKKTLESFLLEGECI